jgi:hypothetical protein
MNREEKILMAIDKGITCNPETGEVFGVRGKVIKAKHLCYITIGIRDGKKTYHLLAHQFIYYCVHKKCVDCIDHINGFKDDNRIDNLRSITQQQNTFNTKAKGYSWDKNRNKWHSKIMVNGEHKTLGRYDNEEEARQSYLEAKKTYHII